MLRRGLELLRDEGPGGFWRRARRRLLGAQAGVFRDYPRWLKAGLKAGSQADGPPPRSSLQVAVVVPVCDPPPWALDALLASIRAQEGVAWRLVLSDDGSRDPAVRARLQAAAGESRVRVVTGAQRRGISAATNAGLAVAEGDLVAFVDHDDALAPGALAHVAAAFADPAVGWAYTDEDKLLGQPGERARPFFKPAFDPTLLLRCNPTAHLLVARRDLVAQVGGLRSAFDGSQDYDLALRLAETGRAVAHVPRVLYHWRAVPGSTADRVAAKPWAYAAAQRALEDALRRRGVTGRVSPGAWLGSYRVALEPRVQPGEVSVILDADRAPAWLRALPWGELLTGASGTAAGRAARAAAARGRCLLFIGDVRPAGRGDPGRARVARERLGALLAEADRPGVGLVAARLVAGGRLGLGLGRVLEHGLRVAADGRCLPVEATLDEGDPGYFGLAGLTRSVGAASGQALLVARATLDALGGLDAARFSGGGAFVDLCRRATAAGLRTVSVAEATLEVARGCEGLGLEFDRAALAAAGPVPDPWTSPHWRDDALALADLPGPFAPRVR